MTFTQRKCNLPSILPNSDGTLLRCPIVMTEEELIRFLRIPEISGPGTTDMLSRISNATTVCPGFISAARRSTWRTPSSSGSSSTSPVVNETSFWYNGLGPTQAFGQHRKGGDHETTGKA